MLKIDLSSVSTHRSELMGISMLGVLWCHFTLIGGHPSEGIIRTSMDILAYSLFTQGFLFCSGMGLYHSYQKDNNIKNFYKKRFKRVYLPYLAITLPYFIYTDLIIGKEITDFIFHITGFYFFIYGNYSGMWYISVTLLLYLIFPILYHILFKNRSFFLGGGDKTIYNSCLFADYMVPL